MLRFKFYIFISFITLIFTASPKSFADNHNVIEILELIQKDLKTLEKAVYSDSFDKDSDGISNSNSLDQNSEDVLTRHLLKLSEIENQFQELTNKFEEINFKLDKLSSRLSKVQADNQIRFQQLENGAVTLNQEDKKLTSIDDENKLLQVSSEHQDLG